MKLQSILSTLFITALLVATSSASAQGAYRYTDPATGKTVISDHPPPKSTKDVQTESAGASSKGEISYGARMAAEKYPVVLYTSADCTDTCVKARELLNKRGVPFTEKIVTTPELQEELTKLVGNVFTPSITIGSQVMKGLEPVSWNNLLDLAGYPKTAAFGSKPSGAFTQ